MNGHKVLPQHLERKAYVYVRQSSQRQVEEHLESQDLQYQLVHRAQTLGWPESQVVVIDDDLGNGITTTYSYYPAATGNNRLWQIQVGGGSLLDLEYGYDDVGNVAQIVDGQVQTQSFTYDALDRLTGASAQAGGPWAAYSGRYEYDRVGNLRLKAEGGITHTMQYSDTAHVHAASAVDGVPQSYDANGNMTERAVDGVTYAQGWDQENRLVWASTGGVTTTFTYDANGALVKKEDPLVGTTYYVGPHYEVLAPAVILPPAPTDLEACHASGSPPNVCNDLTWTGSSGVTYNVYRNTTSPVPIDAGHLVTSGITETEYTDCGSSLGASCWVV